MNEVLVAQSRALDLGRLAAFALRLAAIAQFLDVGGALGLLAVLERMLRYTAALHPNHKFSCCTYLRNLNSRQQIMWQSEKVLAIAQSMSCILLRLHGEASRTRSLVPINYD